MPHTKRIRAVPHRPTRRPIRTAFLALVASYRPSSLYRLEKAPSTPLETTVAVATVVVITAAATTLAATMGALV